MGKRVPRREVIYQMSEQVMSVERARARGARRRISSALVRDRESSTQTRMTKMAPMRSGMLEMGSPAQGSIREGCSAIVKRAGEG